MIGTVYDSSELSCVEDPVFTGDHKGTNVRKRELTPKELRSVQLTELEVLSELDRICKKNNIEYVIIAGTLLGAVRHKGFIPWDDDIDVAMRRSEYERFREACGRDLDGMRFVFQDDISEKGYRWGYGKLRRKNTLFLRAGQEHMPYFQGIFIDVFPIDPCPKGWPRRMVQNLKCFVVRKMLWAKVGKVNSGSGLVKKVYAALDHIPEEKILGWYHALIKRAEKYEGSGWSRILMFPTPNRCYGYRSEWYEGSSDYEFEGRTFPGVRDADHYLSFKFGKYKELPPEKDRKVHPVSRLKLLPAELLRERDSSGMSVQDRFLADAERGRAYIFGTGYVSQVLGEALRLYGLSENICAYVETSPKKQNFEGCRVISLENFINESEQNRGRLYLAVHDALADEVLIEIQKALADRNNSLSARDAALQNVSEIPSGVRVYPFLFDLLYGPPKQELCVIPLRQILAVQDAGSYWIAARYAALEYADTGNELFRSLYLKALVLFSGRNSSEKRLGACARFYENIKTNGFDPARPILLDENGRVIDGLHRIAIAARLGIDELPCRIYEASHLYDKVLDDRNFLRESLFAKAGFTKEETELLRRCQALILNNR